MTLRLRERLLDLLGPRVRIGEIWQLNGPLGPELFVVEREGVGYDAHAHVADAYMGTVYVKGTWGLDLTCSKSYFRRLQRNGEARLVRPASSVRDARAAAKGWSDTQSDSISVPIG